MEKKVRCDAFGNPVETHSNEVSHSLVAANEIGGAPPLQDASDVCVLTTTETFWSTAVPPPLYFIEYAELAREPK
jgi:hypothetical protein